MPEGSDLTRAGPAGLLSGHPAPCWTQGRYPGRGDTKKKAGTDAKRFADRTHDWKSTDLL